MQHFRNSVQTIFFFFVYKIFFLSRIFSLLRTALCAAYKARAIAQIPVQWPLLYIVSYFAASNSASISFEGAGVTRLTTTQTSREVRKAGSSS